MELSKLRKLQNSLKRYSINMIFNSFVISEEELQPTGERTRTASGRRATHCSKCGKPKRGHKKGQCAWNTDTLYFLVTWTEHACQVSNYFLPEISLRPGKWLKHLPSVLKIVVTTDILITESFSIHFYSFSFAFSSQDAATINLFMFVFLTTCRPINLCSDFCCWSWLLLPVPVVAPKPLCYCLRLIVLSIIIIFEPVILLILLWKVLPYLIISTAWQRVASRATNVVPEKSCKLSVGHCPQEPTCNKTRLN